MRSPAWSLVLAALVVAHSVGACRPRASSPTPAPAVPAATFRFSPRPNRAAGIHWQVFSEAAFAQARAERKPVLLSLAAVWCHWCHVLDETTLSDPRVIATLNRDFVPVRVDADQRPDVESRYLLGGWPTVAFLDGDGAILEGGTYVPPERFLEMTRTAAARLAGTAPRVALGNAYDPTSPGALDAVVEGVVRALGRAADLSNGGFGGTPKFPQAEAVELLLDVGERELARAALEAMLKLEDPVEGGFYRYATRPDWTVPHYEKMLYVQAELLGLYARAGEVLGEPRYREAARRTVAWVRRTLTAPDGSFYASQDADERYYTLDAAGRRGQPAPYIDRTLLVDRNARMILALVGAAGHLDGADRKALLDDAGRAAAVLASLRTPEGLFFHCRRPGSAPEWPGLLADQAWGARSLVEVARASGDAPPEAARRAMAAAVASLADPRGGFFDVPVSAGAGLLRRRDKALDGNAAMALALESIGNLDGARRTLAMFGGSYPLFGTESALYARAVERVTAASLPTRAIGRP